MIYGRVLCWLLRATLRINDGIVESRRRPPRPLFDGGHAADETHRARSTATRARPRRVRDERVHVYDDFPHDDADRGQTGAGRQHILLFGRLLSSHAVLHADRVGGRIHVENILHGPALRHDPALRASVHVSAVPALSTTRPANARYGRRQIEVLHDSVHVPVVDGRGLVAADAVPSR